MLVSRYAAPALHSHSRYLIDAYLLWMTSTNSLVIEQLETDSTLLIPKSRVALERYGHQVVIGNELHTRKYQVVFVEPRDMNISSSRTGTNTDERFKEEWIKIQEDDNVEIEKLIVERLIARHTAWINRMNSSQV